MNEQQTKKRRIYFKNIRSFEDLVLLCKTSTLTITHTDGVVTEGASCKTWYEFAEKLAPEYVGKPLDLFLMAHKEVSIEFDDCVIIPDELKPLVTTEY